MVKPKETSEWLRMLANCEKIVPDEEVYAFGKINDVIDDDVDNVRSDDEVDEDLEADSERLNEILGLPMDTYSLTRITPNLPECVKYGVRSGLTHMNMNKFSSFSRGLQGPAIAIAAYATTGLIKAPNWNEPVIDQIIEDGDAYYCNSYKKRIVRDRRLLGVHDLDKSLKIQNTHRVDMHIDDAAYTGLFRSENPTEMHLVKALELFFQNYDAALLTSSHLNISIWRDGRYYNIFDGQPRRDDLLPVDSHGNAKLILLDDFVGIIFIILEKSNVMNEHFVLYPLNIVGVSRIIEDNHSEAAKFIDEPQRRASGYNIQGLRALIRGTFHMMHSSVPEIIRGHAHLIVALIAIIYSKLVPTNKWNTAIVDLIFNQAHIYFVDLVRVIDKQIDDNFSLNINDLLGDVFLGVYAAKVQIQSNVIPGDGKKGKGKGKGKVTLESGLLEFFEIHQSAILEVKKIFYAIWKDGNVYYFFDPFACDRRGFRVDPTDEDLVETYKTATSCITMNSSIKEVIEIILENTDSTVKDPFILHAIQILYVKTGAYSQGLPDTVIYRGKKTNRRPLPPLSPSAPEQLNHHEIKVDTTPKPRIHADKRESKATQYPELFKDIDDYMMKDNDIITNNDVEVQKFMRYNIVNPHRIILCGEKNCMDSNIDSSVRGRQGLSMALSAIAQSKLKHPSQWSSLDIDKVIDIGNGMYYDLAHLDAPSLTDEDDYDSDDDDDDSDESDDSDYSDDSDDESDDENRSQSILNDQLPDKIKLGANTIELQNKMSMIEGVADPLVNLGEALDHYFNRYYELILENRNLMYGIWKLNCNYAIFNPYGSDPDGWRWRGFPASLIVADSLRELVDLLHGILDFNDRSFKIHFIHIELDGPDKNTTKTIIELPESEMKKYQTLFLPLTDDDLAGLKVNLEEEQEKKLKVGDESEGEDDEEDTEDDDEDTSESEDGEVNQGKITEMNKVTNVESTEMDPFIETREEERLDAPSQLNLFLVTANVGLVDEKVDAAAKEALEYERLKYNHPPPYVLPPKGVLAMLLTAKNANKSVSSLVSRFSIDSKLEVKINLPLDEEKNSPTINNIEDQETSKLIKLPPKKYFYSRVLPIGFTPLRAVNEKFIYDEKIDEELIDESAEKDSKTLPALCDVDEVPESSEEIRITPVILPLGPLIKTPLPKKKTKPCIEKKRRRCKLSAAEQNDEVLKKIVCNTEEVLFNIIFSKPNLNGEPQDNLQSENEEEAIEFNLEEASTIPLNNNSDEEDSNINLPSEAEGFRETIEGNRIISANIRLDGRQVLVEKHFKSCFFAAILCLLAKTKYRPNTFRSSLLDELIYLAEKYFKLTGSLQYKKRLKFNNFALRRALFNTILGKYICADPEHHEPDRLPNALKRYFIDNTGGILVFENASFASWHTKKGWFYLFDPYGCDGMGHADETGSACLLKFPNLNNLITKIEHHSSVAVDEPYRIYTLSISHVERPKKGRNLNRRLQQFNEEIDRKRRNSANEEEEEEEEEEDEAQLLDETKLMVEPKASLIESSEWLKKKNEIQYKFDMNIPGFAPLINANASVLEVRVIENDITRPILAPFESMVEKPGKNDESPLELPRRKPFDRKFNEHSILGVPLDLCITAWSCIHEPTVWGVRTIRGIYDASQDLAYDSLLSAEDTTVGDMIDGVLNEFDIANYRFHVKFAPIHFGKLYSRKGWNLAMSVRKFFDTPIYTGAFISCGRAHIGIMRKNENFYAWWGVVGTKNLRIVTSQVMEDFLRLIIQEIDESQEIKFKMRFITISYGKKLDPDCTDMKGLHVPTNVASLPQIYRKKAPNYDLQNLFRSTIPSESQPVFILGTVALGQFELVKEPCIKRCYFIAILAVMVKRDIIQSLMPSMIDKVMQVGEVLYREFVNPKYHTEHILRNVTVMNRIFDFRDVASPLYKFKRDIATGTDDFCSLILTKLQQYFKKHSHGIIHFSNCCYAFWYSESTTFYYLLDPYPCNSQGKRVLKNGGGCLGIFSSLCQMVKSLMLKRAPNTTGFFIHNIHIESINVAPSDKFVEDPMWVYLDYHWCASHAPSNTRNRRKKKCNNSDDFNDQHLASKQMDRPTWNNYTIEIPNLIYSIWGTLGAYDSRFGVRAGKNQAAICVAVLAMQHLCHPSKWNAAILDSAVICGDCYYTESLKSAARRGNKYSNKFHLQPSFKVFPNAWQIEYGEIMCGMLYGGHKRTTLATTLKLGLEQSSNIIINCENITLAVVFAGDGYYAADPCWTGPPLFLRNHGALYVLRCRNLNTLVYVITKMINSNLRLEFTVTPVKFSFNHEICIGVSKKSRSKKKRILSDTVECQPNDVMTPKVAVRGAVAVPDNDVYLEYRENVGLGIECGSFFENPSVPSPVPQLNEDMTRNLITSTEWHNNIGKGTRRKRSQPPIDSTMVQHQSEHCYNTVAVDQQMTRAPPGIDSLYIHDDYPRTVDFLDDKYVVKSTKPLTQTNVVPEMPTTKPLDCLPPTDFILDRSKREFERHVIDMADDSYKTYEHKISNHYDNDHSDESGSENDKV